MVRQMFKRLMISISKRLMFAPISHIRPTSFRAGEPCSHSAQWPSLTPLGPACQPLNPKFVRRPGRVFSFF